MSRVLVTGANGFVGRHLIKELIENGKEVVAVGGNQQDKISNDKVLEYIELDLRDMAEVMKLDFGSIDGVIHLAGLADVGASFEDPMNYISTNIGIEANLFEAASAQNSKAKFLIVSSGSVYEPGVQAPLTEKSNVLPSSPYAVSKLGQENLANYYTTRGFKCVIARPFNHIGPGQGPGFIVPDVAKQVLGHEKGALDKVMVGNLSTSRDYTDVRDIVRAYRLLLDKGDTGEIYNVCSGKTLSGQQLVAGIKKASGSSAEIVEDPERFRPSEIQTVCGDYSKLRALTNWSPAIDIEQTLADVIDEMRQRS